MSIRKAHSLLHWLAVAIIASLVGGSYAPAQNNTQPPAQTKVKKERKRITPKERKEAARRVKAKRLAAARAKGLTPMAAALAAVTVTAADQIPGVPNYFGKYSNWANSPLPKARVVSIDVTDPGAGYSPGTQVVITDAYGTGTNAAAHVTLGTGGSIASITVDTRGNGYTAPIVSIVDPLGTGEGAAAQANLGGVITGGMRKFVDPLPPLGCPPSHSAGVKCIPVAVADKATYPGSDYYEIELGMYQEKMHSDLPNPTTLYGYRQTNDGGDDHFHYLGPVIVAQKDTPVRIKFTNNLPTGPAGRHILPVDKTIMGAGPGPSLWNGDVFPGSVQNPDTLCGSPGAIPTGCYTENRADLHLHGGRTPWISDGTPHQWIVPAGESTSLTKGVSMQNVPDMPDPGQGSQTYYYTNGQSARLMFYHDHASGLTRLNVYAGEAAGYIIRDETELELIAGGIIPSDEIPLIIQDKTFVDAATILKTDPLWSWGKPDANGNPTMLTGDLWWPHVYMPAQNPYDISGVAPMGRWMYGPWFWPPTSGIAFPPVPNPYADPANLAYDPAQPPEMPGTPHPSWGAEAFLDTPVINGTAYPTLTVQPKAYRFRILNAAHDRFWNLQLYRAQANGTEVAMVQNSPDNREGGIPNPARQGPNFIQIGTEGGFLPQPVVIPNQYITWNYNPTTFNFGNVDKHALLLGPAERADVIVDFSQFAGQTLILYNDAPAAFPALDARNDYYTGKVDHSLGGDASGGTPPTLPGYGPNTRTLMQIKVGGTTNGNPFDLSALQQAFRPAGGAVGVFAASQDPIIVGQSAYNSTYSTTFPSTYPNWGVSRIHDNSLSFVSPPVNGTPGTPMTVPMQPKAIHDEMGAVYDDYGRMSAKLGLEVPFTNNLNQTFVMQNYVDKPTEIVGDSEVQIWKITHNGVDTHPIHFHLFDVQLINRVGWDNIIRLPEPNELGWKDTVRISPLEDTIVALRPQRPKQPFGIPDSIRMLNPALPAGATAGFTTKDQFGQPINPPVVNALYNFGWEYVWHCHILSHEESDMMRPIEFRVNTGLPIPPVLTAVNDAGTVTLSWTDGTPANDPGTLGNLQNEIGFRVERAVVGSNGIPGAYTLLTTALANATGPVADTLPDQTNNYAYRVVAYNAKGNSPSAPVTIGPPASLSIVPTSLDFPARLQGTTSTALTAQLRNTGGTAATLTDVVATVSGANATDFLLTENCGTSLAPGAFCTLTVRFRPTAKGARSAQIVVTSGTATATLLLSGIGTAPELTLAPTALTFAAGVGVVSAPQIVTVTNTGDAPLVITSVSNVSQFARTVNCGLTQANPLAPGSSCTISVTFNPTTAASPKSGTLTVNVAAPATSKSVALTGNVTAPIYTVTPENYAFGNIAVAGGTSTQMFTVQNTGTVPLTINSITRTSATQFPGFTHNCPLSAANQRLAAGASCTINVTFDPTTLGAKTSNLSVTVAAPGTSKVVPLTGSGI
jgi:FtsP/CotA-like multicopper oxidase with cupredoxin domain